MAARMWVLVGLAALILGSPGAARATFTDAYFFGASWTDTGNRSPSDVPGFSFSAYGYDPARWTLLHGTLWSDALAASLGVPSAAIASSDGGNNYAVADSRADEVAAQITASSAAAGGSADPGALYAIWVGTNDLLQGQTAASTVGGVRSAVGHGYAQGLNLCSEDLNCPFLRGTAGFVMHDHLHFMPSCPPADRSGRLRNRSRALARASAVCGTRGPRRRTQGVGSRGTMRRHPS